MQTGSTLVRVARTRPAAGTSESRERLGCSPVRSTGTVRSCAHAVMLNGGIVQVLDGEGFLVETRTVPSPLERPRWYVVPRPLFWALAVVFLVQGVVGVAGRGPTDLRFWLAVAQLLLGVFYPVLMIMSRRHDRLLLHSDPEKIS